MSLISFSGLSRTNRVLPILSILTAAGLTGSAQAALFSFASDDASNAFTFVGTAGAANTFTMTQQGARIPVTLKIDDNNGPLPTVALNVFFEAEFTLGWIGSLGTGNSQTHAYSATGNFRFVDANGGVLLSIATTGQNPAGMTIGGTMSNWASAGSLFGSDNAGGGTVAYTTTPALFTLASGAGANLEQYGIFGGANATSIGTDDFGFSLTFVSAATGGPVPIDSTSRLPTGAWRAEGSYSGSATWIPAPGTMALVGIAGGLIARRRRR